MKLISAIALLAAIGCTEALSIQAVQQPQHHIAIDNNKSGNPGSLVWENCGTPDDLLQISSLEYSPQNPIRGEPITVTLKGQMSGDLDKGSKVIVAVKWGGVPIPLPPMDVCDQLDSLPDSPKCPLPAGDVSVKQSFILPTQTPDGLITALIKIRSQERKQVACLKSLVAFLQIRAKMIILMHFLMGLNYMLRSSSTIYEVIEPTAQTSWFTGENRVVHLSSRLAAESDTIELCRVWLHVFRPRRFCKPLEVISKDIENDVWMIRVPERYAGRYYVRLLDHSRLLAESQTFRYLEEIPKEGVHIDSDISETTGESIAKIELSDIKDFNPDRYVYRVRLIDSTNGRDLADPKPIDPVLIKEFKAQKASRTDEIIIDFEAAPTTTTTATTMTFPLHFYVQVERRRSIGSWWPLWPINKRRWQTIRRIHAGPFIASQQLKARRQQQQPANDPNEVDFSELNPSSSQRATIDSPRKGSERSQPTTGTSVESASTAASTFNSFWSAGSDYFESNSRQARTQSVSPRTDYLSQAQFKALHTQAASSDPLERAHSEPLPSSQPSLIKQFKDKFFSFGSSGGRREATLPPSLTDGFSLEAFYQISDRLLAVDCLADEPVSVEIIVCRMRRLKFASMNGERLNIERWRKQRERHDDSESEEDEDYYYGDDDDDEEEDDAAAASVKETLAGKNSEIAANDLFQSTTTTTTGLFSADIPAETNNESKPSSGERWLTNTKESAKPLKASQGKELPPKRLTRNGMREAWQRRLAESQQIAAMINSLRKSATLISAAHQDDATSRPTSSGSSSSSGGVDDAITISAPLPAKQFIRKRRYLLLRAALDNTMYYLQPSTDKTWPRSQDPVITALDPQIDDYKHAYSFALEYGEKDVAKSIERLQMFTTGKSSAVSSDRPKLPNVEGELMESAVLLPVLVNAIQRYNAYPEDEENKKQLNEYLLVVKAHGYFRIDGAQQPYGEDSKEFWRALSALKPRQLRGLNRAEKLILYYILSVDGDAGLLTDREREIIKKNIR